MALSRCAVVIGFFVVSAFFPHALTPHIAMNNAIPIQTRRATMRDLLMS
jgi:hypothetical protein